MSIFDTEEQIDMKAVAEHALQCTYEFLHTYCKSLHVPSYNHEYKSIIGSFVETRQKTETIHVRQIFGPDMYAKFSRLDAYWNEKDNIVDILVLDPKSPVYIENIQSPDILNTKYFRFVTKAGRPIIFYRKQWSELAFNEGKIPCKNMDKVKYTYTNPLW